MIALLSDVHANLEALDACLAHARAQGARRFVFLGDYVGYGADAAAVVDRLTGLAAQGAVLVKGNHDHAVETDARYMNDSARAAIDWARATLSPAQKSFLAGLPLIVREPDMCFVHATADAPERWNYVDSERAALASANAADRTYTFSGHVHFQELHFENAPRGMRVFRPQGSRPIPVFAQRRWLALVGSVGQPRDGKPASAYALFDRRSSRLAFFRIPYDHASAAAKIRKAGLPESLAYRLEAGV